MAESATYSVTMVQPNGTVITLVAGDAQTVEDLLEKLERRHLHNVDAVSLRSEDARDAAPRLLSSHATYIVSDADPLEHVAAAWVEFFDSRSTLGTLEIEVERAVEQLESGAVVMPDYYLLLDPEGLEGTWRHWWLGVLPAQSRNRVLPTAASVDRVNRLLSRLPSGRAWPRPARWLRTLERTVPDRAGLESGSMSGTDRDGVV